MKKIFIYTIVVASSLAAGSLLGFGSKKLFKKEIDYSNADISAYVPDYQAIVDEIDGYTGNKGLFEKFSTSKVLNYSLEKFRTSENCATFTFGLSHSSVVDQLIRGCDIKNGNEYFEESLSKSKLVSVASRIYQTGAKSTAKFYQGSESDLVINDNEAYTSYSNSYKSFDSATYKATYGKTIDEMFIYLICEEGILSKTVTSNSDGYKVACKFDNEISTYFNKIQMQGTSDLAKQPEFRDVNLTFELNKNYQLKKVTIDETYDAAKKIVGMNIATKLHAVIDIYFYTFETGSPDFVKIPTLDEKVEYRKD